MGSTRGQLPSRAVRAAAYICIAFVAAACSDGPGGNPLRPSAGGSPDSAARQQVQKLPTPNVVDAGVCEQLTLSWDNPGVGGNLAQTWHLELWEIVSGVRVDPKLFNDANYGTTSYTLSVAPGTYEVRITAKTNAPGVQNSDLKSFFFTVLPCGSTCTLTQGYWKNHPEAWPVASLALGARTYSASELLDILNQPPSGGNGLVSLAHQLIAAKLNLARGADGTALGTAVADADALIGSLVVPPVGSGFLASSATSALTTILDDYNSGVTGPGHCAD